MSKENLEKKEKRIISASEVPACVRKKIQMQEKEKNKREKIKEEIQNKIESIFLNTFTIPANQKYVKRVQEALNEKFIDMTREVVINVYKSYIEGNSLLPEVSNFRAHLDEKLELILDSIIEKLLRTYIETLNEKQVDIKNEILKAYANACTERIADVIAEKELESQRYMRGEFKLVYTGHSALSCELYFQDKRRQWGKVSFKTIPIRKEYVIKEVFEKLKEKVREKEDLLFEF